MKEEGAAEQEEGAGFLRKEGGESGGAGGFSRKEGGESGGAGGFLRKEERAAEQEEGAAEGS